MRSGKLRQRLVIEKDEGTSVDPLGGRTESWQTVAEVRASSAHKSGKEFERAQQVVAEVSTLFVVRYDSRLSPLGDMQSMRVRSVDDGSIHRILYAEDDGRRNKKINIYTSEGQSG